MSSDSYNRDELRAALQGLHDARVHSYVQGQMTASQALGLAVTALGWDRQTAAEELRIRVKVLNGWIGGNLDGEEKAKRKGVLKYMQKCVEDKIAYYWPEEV